MNPIFRFVAAGYVALLLTWFPKPSLADSIECGNGIIQVGDTRERLSDLCGKPTQVIQGSSLKWDTERPAARGALSGGPDVMDSEIWIYDFGSNKLMQRVQIRDGVVVKIESLGYGSN